MSRWIDTTTGELMPEGFAAPGGAGYVLLEEPPAKPHPDAWLPDWVLRQLLHVKTERRVLRSRLEQRLAQLDALETHYRTHWGPRVEAAVRSQLAAEGGGSRSVRYDLGRCGWRRTKRIVVDEDAEPIRWCELHYPEAVRTEQTLRKTAALQAGCPGVWEETEDRFYVRPDVGA